MIQGFYFAKPMPAHEYAERMRKNMEEMNAKAEEEAKVAEEAREAEDEALKVN